MKHLSIQDLLFAGISLISVAIYLALTVGDLGHTTFDDAYMYTRYAKHWLAGESWSWNGSDGPSFGVTSPLYLLAVTAIMGLTGCADAMALTIASFIAGLLTVAVLVALGFIVQAGRTTRTSWVPLLTVPCLLLVQPFPNHCLTGMETTFSLLANSLLACAMVLDVRWRTKATLLFCLFSGGMSYATRPDNGLYAVLLPPLFFIAADRSLWKRALCYMSILAAMVLGSLIVHRFVFGDFLPLSFYAKSQGFYEGYAGAHKWNAMKQMFIFHAAATPFLLVIAGTKPHRALRQLIPIAVVITTTFAYYASVTQIMGFDARFYYPSLAFVVLATYAAAFPKREEDQETAARGTRGLPYLLCLIVLLPILVHQGKAISIDLWEKHVMGKHPAIRSTMEYRAAAEDALPRLGWWPSIVAMSELLEHIPKETVLAASEYGFIGSRFAELTIVDLVGLHDRVLAHHGFDADHVLSREPDLVWLPHVDYTGAVAKILDHPTFQRDYEYYPGAYDHGIALRKNSAEYDDIRQAVGREFSRIYPGRSLSHYSARPQLVSSDRN